jgi:hypothetical protein
MRRPVGKIMENGFVLLTLFGIIMVLHSSYESKALVIAGSALATSLSSASLVFSYAKLLESGSELLKKSV